MLILRGVIAVPSLDNQKNIINQRALYRAVLLFTIAAVGIASLWFLMTNNNLNTNIPPARRRFL